ncbi:Plant self-incompatibility S1 [Arabidopsis suecica]|uniref:S-protein homolog n=1 Tax=Arabidopsis suecica TaxID=45249 RepID=A0A8T2CGJ0_ARASU|nr:Plant self-incompatibility S1 [Arabidopsis suecica]
MKYLLVFLFVYAMCIIGNVYGGETNTLNIWNDLDPNHKHTSLFVHCKSGSSDRGKQEVLWGKKYTFPIRDNIWKTTLFWCTFRHGPRYQIGAVFDVYEYKAGVAQGGTYEWTAREDGIYFRLNQGTIHKVHNWKPMPW